ncbi:MAG: molybdopterin-dependent oxidoreductase [Anaerolineae bacterium]|nr:molybdopterin-dependent oxidoreductase [Anaerolineae bacterium]
MRPRLVDWTLYVLVAAVTLTGFGSWLIADWEGRLIFYAHAIAGLAVVVPLAWKLRRVRPRIVRTDAWDWKTPLSVLTALAAIGAVATGIFWTHAQLPTGYPNGMHLHIVCGLALVVLISLHVLMRLRLPTRRDAPGRRDALRWLGMLGFGAALLPVQEGINHAFDLPGARRRFTGSRHAASDSGNAFPITNWMFDRPAPVDVDAWRLTVRGALARELSLDYAEIASATATLRATLDCTGGWYSTQNWRGVRVGDLLEQAGLLDQARFVSFVSVTGYRWSLPIAEARGALLATHVGDEPLDHWHGAPLRLVAPGRRGFMWVKWVHEVVVLTRPDPGRWVAIFTSGLTTGH